VAGDDPVVGVGAGEPGVEVGLPAGGQGVAAGAQPVEQANGGANPLADHVELAVGGVGVAVALSESAQKVPDRVAVQQLFVVRVAVLGDGAGDPSFDPSEVLVAGGECAGGTGTLRKCSSGLLGGKSSSAAWFSGPAPVARSASTDLTTSRLSQFNAVAGRSMLASVSCRTWSSGRIAPVVSASSPRSCWCRRQRLQAPAVSRPVVPQPVHVFQKPRS
jgi:hypothetical protein